MELDDVVLYHDDSASSAVMSERVSGLASSIYREFERLIERYGEDVVKELMPLVVAVLENLDSVFAVNQEHEVELELLREDNEQLVTQYEREKALRKHTEERYIALEDSQDGEKKELQCRLVMLESHSRQLELKTKNYADQISRLDERESELKKEYNTLHQRHTEMIHSYMEHLERSKHQHGVTAAAEPTDTGTKTRKERPIPMGIFQLPGSDGLTPDLQREPVDAPAEPWRFNNLSHPRSNTSLKDEMSSFNQRGSKSNQGVVSRAPVSSQGGALKSKSSTFSASSQSVTPLSPPDDGSSTALSPGSSSAYVTALSAATSDVSTESEQETSDGLNKNLDRIAGKPESSKNITAMEEEQQRQHGHDGQQRQQRQHGHDGHDDQDHRETGVTDDLEKSEVQAIIESTPELDMELDGCRGTSTPTKFGVENVVFDRNTDSLFAELSSAGNDLIGDVDEGADMLGMGREVEHLIQENAQLLETKNALNVVKNELMAQMDELTCEKEVLRGELESVTQAKSQLEDKNKDLEDELRKVRAELEESKHKVKNENEDDSDVPTAQRKRFTRVEMARVLMERNQYKERLMELQEAVRWTEMIRASKENPALPEKKKSSLWQL